MNYGDFIASVTNGPKLLHCTWSERLAGDKHSSLWGPFVSYDETEVLWISRAFLQVFDLPEKNLAWEKKSSLLSPFVSDEEKKVFVSLLQDDIL